MSIVIYSHECGPDSWGWRHLLAWRQLSALWGIQIEQNVLKDLPESPVSAHAYSLALAPNEFPDSTKLQNYLAAAPMVLFLHRVMLQVHGAIAIDVTEDQTPTGSCHHSFKVNQKSFLTTGLPEHVTVYGPLVDITPLPNENDLQILVWVDGVPVIGYRSPHLLVGADAWQLGNPTVPLVYPILFNWLKTVVGCDVRLTKPYAAIRLDDWPSTAAALLHHRPTPTLDRQRAATLRRLRKYALRFHVPLSLMYSSHYYLPDGHPIPIADEMPRSIHEMQLGVEQKVFEIGAHGMLHLRYPRDKALQDSDPREFLDLDDEQTTVHLSASVREIRRVFGVSPESFVSPAWGYRQGVTKKIAAQQFEVIIDSSQHIEDSSAEVFSASSKEHAAFNCTETFRPGSRMLSFTSPEFWKCYALAGIPIHYMQHTDMNWHLLRNFLGSQIDSARLLKVTEHMQNARNSRVARYIAAAFLLANALWNNPASMIYLWKLLTASSLYSIVDAVRLAGYCCMGITEIALHSLGREHQ